MIIKVCGIKDVENLLDVCRLDITMVGYNFYALSPRYVDRFLPEVLENIKKVGVFVNATLREIKEKKELYSLDYAQLHGDESVSFVKKVKSFMPVIKVFRIHDQFDPTILEKYNFCDFFLFDKATEKYGGSGQKFDWKIIKNWKIECPFLLSGGIGPEDVKEILKIIHPQFKGIDINSKFEKSPGIKDVAMVQKFVERLRNTISSIFPCPIRSRRAQSLKGRPTLKDTEEALISPLGAGGKKSKNDTDLNPQSLKGRPTLKDSEDAIFSPLGVGGKKSKNVTDLNPQSLKGRPTLKDSEEALFSPLGVGGKKSKNDTDLNPQSLMGRPTLKDSEEALISPLGAGGKKDVTNENNYNMFYGASPIIFERAASLRRNMTSEEIKVWNFLKSKPLGFKFRRQHPIDLFIADFYCHDVKLVIEIDGINHQYSLVADLNRENILKSLGITILRFKNTQVHSNLEGVIHKILEEANHLKNPLSKKLNHLL